jgi:putative ABC transport system permease protein
VFFALLTVLLFVGALGLANTLTLGVLRRTGEIGLLRALGASRQQTVVMLLAEGLAMGIVGFALAVPLGFAVSRMLADATSASLGFDLAFRIPLASIAVCGIASALAAIGGSGLPARRAGRVEPARALLVE